MTKENYGKYYDLDHVIPSSCLSIEEGNIWSNLRPLEKKENNFKSNKRDPILESNHALKAQEFYRNYEINKICKDVLDDMINQITLF